jgi:plastocyanin
MPFRLGLIAAVLAVVVTVTGGAHAANQTVTALSGPNRFSPSSVTINVGETVTWNNGSGTHNVQFNDGSYEMPADPSSSSWTVSRTFNTPGTFSYICRQHGTSMSGSVTVLPVNPPPGNPPPGNPPPSGGPPVQGPGGGGTTNPGSGGPAPGGQTPGDESPASLKVTLTVSDATPLAGKRVRVSGVVRPARDGRKVQIQKRLRNGKFKTIATTRLREARGDKSTYSLRLRLSADTLLRARVAGDDERATGLSKGRKLDVHKPA